MGKRRIDKNERIGEKRINSNGFIMTLIDYIDCNNVTIQFEDGEIVYNKYYYNFKKGNIKKENNKYNINYNLKKELSLGYLYPNIARMIAIKENDLDFENTFYILPKSSVKVYYYCDKCNTLSNKTKRICDLVNCSSCEYCSDGISIPEKFIRNILNQLNIKFIMQLNKSILKWCQNYRYDFYIPLLNIIIETHGLQHYERGFESCGGRSLEQEQENDKLKKELALNNNVDNYIIIDCRYSEFNWLKDNAIKELNKYFDLSNINWELAWEESQNNLCVNTWRLWNENKEYTINDISKLLFISNDVIRKYLKKGEKIGVCVYNVRRKEKKGKEYYNSTPVICLTTKRIFNTIHEGAEFYNCYSSGICKCCKNKIKSHKGLVWKYLIWQHNIRLKYNEINNL